MKYYGYYGLYHHQVKGAHWGIHNGPPYPLDRTKSDGHKLIKSDGSPQGKKRYKTSEDTTYKKARTDKKTESVLDDVSYDTKNVEKANDIYRTLSKKEKYYLTADKQASTYVKTGEYGETGKPSSIVYSRIEQYKNVPVSVIDIWQNEDKMGEVSIAVRNDKRFRHNGYARRALEDGLKYFYNNPEMEYLIWGVNAKNHPSIELAKKYGFTFFEDVDGEWHTYVKDKKKDR